MDQGLSDKKPQNLHEKVLNHFSNPPLTYQNTHNLYNAGKKRYFFFLFFFLGGSYNFHFFFFNVSETELVKDLWMFIDDKFLFFFCV